MQSFEFEAIEIARFGGAYFHSSPRLLPSSMASTNSGMYDYKTLLKTFTMQKALTLLIVPRKAHIRLRLQLVDPLLHSAGLNVPCALFIFAHPSGTVS